MGRIHLLIALPLAALFGLLGGPMKAQDRVSIQLGPDSPELAERIASRDRFGLAVCSAGDLNGDGAEDLLVGAPGTAGNGDRRGAVYVLFLDLGLSIKDVHRIDDSDPELMNLLADGDEFGSALLNLDDLDGDGTLEAAVGVPGADGKRGAVWILSLSAEGEVRAVSQIDTSSSEHIELKEDDLFGRSLSIIHDSHETEFAELAIGAPNVNVDLDKDRRGRVFTLRLQKNSTSFGVDTARIRYSGPDFVDRVLPHGKLRFGFATAQLYDFDGNGTGDLAVGTPSDESARQNGGGAVVVGGLDADTLLPQSLLFATNAEGAQAGTSLASIDDIDGNGVGELLVGAPFKDRPGRDRGEVYRLFLDAQGQIVTIDSLSGSPGLRLEDYDRFGNSIARLPDLNGDGRGDFVIGAPGYHRDRGSVWIVFDPGIVIATITDVSVEPISTPTVSEPISVVARVADERGIRNARLDLRRGGERSWLTVQMSHDDQSVYFADVPKQFIGEQGFEYVIRAVNEAGFEARYPTEGFLSVRLRQNVTLPVRRGTQTASYRLVTFPLDLDNPSARKNLKHEFGTIDPSKWRFLRYTDSSLEDLAEVDFDIEQGKAYWVLAGTGDRTIDVGPGLTPFSNSIFRIPLQAGWNLVGNPFAFELPIAALTVGGQNLQIRRFESGSWMNDVQAVRPYEGYAVWNGWAARDTLLIDPTFRTLVPEVNSRGSPIEASWHEHLLRLLEPAGADEKETAQSVSTFASILAAYPNPASNSVTLSYVIRKVAAIQISVHDLNGREIETILNRASHPVGTYSKSWVTEALEMRVGSGLYLIRLLVNHRPASERLVTVVR